MVDPASRVGTVIHLDRKSTPGKLLRALEFENASAFFDFLEASHDPEITVYDAHRRKFAKEEARSAFGANVGRLEITEVHRLLGSAEDSFGWIGRALALPAGVIGTRLLISGAGSISDFLLNADTVALIQLSGSSELILDGEATFKLEQDAMVSLQDPASVRLKSGPEESLLIALEKRIEGTFRRNPKAEFVVTSSEEGLKASIGLQKKAPIEISFDSKYEAFMRWIAKAVDPFTVGEASTVAGAEFPVERVYQLLVVLEERGALVRCPAAVASPPSQVRQTASAGKKAPSLRPTDIFVATYPKSGTTWAQMILYQLTTDGEMDFEHIYQVCPYYEIEAQTSPERFEDLANPRIFKTHLSWEQVPKGPARYVYVLRNGMDVAVSYFRHRVKYDGFTASFRVFFAAFLRGEIHPGSWFEHVAGWYERRDASNVLILRYEDLKSDLRPELEKLARFLGIRIADHDWPRILERCSFNFMKTHEARFDHRAGIQWVRSRSDVSAQKEKPTTGFLWKGEVGSWKECLSPLQQELFDEEMKRRLRGLS